MREKKNTLICMRYQTYLGKQRYGWIQHCVWIQKVTVVWKNSHTDHNKLNVAHVCTGFAFEIGV